MVIAALATASGWLYGRLGPKAFAIVTTAMPGGAAGGFVDPVGLHRAGRPPAALYPTRPP